MNPKLVLKRIGISETESNVYIYLLKNGLQKAPSLIKETSIDKASAYEALTKLENKNLIYTVGGKRNKKFGAISPDKLNDFLEEKKSELEEVSTGLTDFIDEIKSFNGNIYRNSNIRIIEGDDGFIEWSKHRLKTPAGGIIREISSNVVQERFMKDKDEYAKWSIEMPKQRLKKKIKMKALMQNKDIENFDYLRDVETTNPVLLKEVRLLPEQPKFKIDCSLLTYADFTSVLRMYKGQFLGIIIEDKLISSLMRNMFDFIWENCEQI